MFFIPFDAVICMTQQIGQFVKVYCPIVALLQLYALSLIGLQAILLLRQQKQKHQVVHILDYVTP
jgi:hypothetical protein